MKISKRGISGSKDLERKYQTFWKSFSWNEKHLFKKKEKERDKKTGDLHMRLGITTIYQESNFAFVLQSTKYKLIFKNVRQC